MASSLRPLPKAYSHAWLTLHRFDLDGDRNGVAATPAHVQGSFMRNALPPMAEESSNAAGLPAASAAELAALQDEVAALRSKVPPAYLHVWPSHAAFACSCLRWSHSRC